MNTEHPQRRRIRAIEELAKGCAFDSEADGTIIKWRTPDIPQPSEADIDAKVAEYKTEYDAQAYARARRPLYPDIGDQLDDLYKEGAFSAAMTAKIKKVKDDNPKG